MVCLRTIVPIVIIQWLLQVAMGLDSLLDNYEETKLRIDTTNWSANNSLLQKRMESNQRNNDNDLRRMPPDGNLSAANRKLVRYWILNGAPMGTPAP